MAGKIVLITGVTRGLGRAMVDEFAQLGHTVCGCGRSEKVIAQLRQQFGPPPLWVEALAKPKQYYHKIHPAEAAEVDAQLGAEKVKTEAKAEAAAGAKPA